MPEPRLVFMRRRDRDDKWPQGSALARHWTLSDDVVFLNHGSFGATPRLVLSAQTEWRTQLERNPIQFMVRDLETLIDDARASLAAFVGSKPENLVFVGNATEGVNTVLQSLDLRAGDELLTTDHEYNACKNALDFIASKTGASVVVARVPFPVSSEQSVVDAIANAITTRTRLLLIDHVTSPTALVMPLEAIVAEAHARHIDVLVDGAHAPGMIPLELDRLGVAYYTANAHKWICAPKGAALLYVRPDKQKGVRPLSISHGANSPRVDRSRFWLEFDWTGTSDPSAILCVKQAIAFMNGLLPGGTSEWMRRNHELALEARAVIGEALAVGPMCPDSMIGSMASILLPDRKRDVDATSPTRVFFHEPLQETLFEKYGIEVPIVPWPHPPKRLVRISAQVYNTFAEFVYLANALKAEINLES